MDQVTDIVVRLRDRAYSSKAPDPLVEEAAKEIERLRRIVSMWEQCATMTRDMYGGCYRPAYVEKLEQTAKALVAAAQPINKAAKTDTTQPRNGTPAKGSVQGVGSVPDSRNAKEPVAWAVRRVCGKWVSILGNAVQAETSRQSFDKMEVFAHEIVPLYRQPQPTLTDAERETLEMAANHLDNCGWSSAAIRNLMLRTAPVTQPMPDKTLSMDSVTPHLEVS